MYCSNCGKKLYENSNFCGNCGTKNQTNKTNKFLKNSKCLLCGEHLENNITICPTCGNDTQTAQNNHNNNSNEIYVSAIRNYDTREVNYDQESITQAKKFILKRDEKIILKEDGFIYNESEEYEHVLVLTNQALIISVDEESQKSGDVIRIPLSQINQCIYHRGGFFGEKYIELVTTNGIDRIDLGHGSGKRLALWEMAINDRYKKDTYDRGYDYYKSINIKTLK